MTEIFRQLNTEWDTLQDSDVTAWATTCTDLSTARTAGDVLATIPTHADAVLSFLICEAQQGTELAGRIVLQAMIGKLVRMATSGKARMVPTAGDDLVTALWSRIMTIRPTDRRNIAGHLALDSLKAAQQFWAHDCEKPPTDTRIVHLAEVRSPLVEHVDTDISAASVLAAAVATGCLDHDTAKLMEALYGGNQDVAKAAASLDVSTATIYRRRNLALATLRSRAVELVEAA